MFSLAQVSSVNVSKIACLPHSFPDFALGWLPDYDAPTASARCVPERVARNANPSAPPESGAFGRF